MPIQIWNSPQLKCRYPISKLLPWTFCGVWVLVQSLFTLTLYKPGSSHSTNLVQSFSDLSFYTLKSCMHSNFWHKKNRATAQTWQKHFQWGPTPKVLSIHLYLTTNTLHDILQTSKNNESKKKLMLFALQANDYEPCYK